MCIKLWVVVFVLASSVDLLAREAVPSVESPPVAERPRVALLSVENTTGEVVYDSLADTIRRTIFLTLNLMDRYVVIDQAEMPSDNLVGQAASFPADTMLWGSVQSTSEGRIQMTITVFDRAEGDVVLSQSAVSQSFLEIFETSDLLINQVIGAFSGQRVGFGSIALETDEEGDYRVYLSGTFMGENLSAVDRVLIGEYELQIEQLFPDGFRLMHEEILQVEDNRRTTVSVQLASTEDIRLAELERTRGLLETALATPMSSYTRAEIELYFAAFAAKQPEPALYEWYRTRVDLESEYRGLLEYRYFIDSRPTFDQGIGRELLPVSYQLRERSAREHRVDLEQFEQVGLSREQNDVVERASLRNITTFSGIMMLASAYNTVLGNYDLQHLPYDAVLQVYEYQGSPNVVHRHVRAERDRARSMGIEYEQAVAQRRPLRQSVAMTIGAVGLTAAGFIFGSDLPGERLDQGNLAYERYQVTEDSNEAERLREEVEGSYTQANMLFASGTIAGVAGLSALTTGIIARARSVRRPQRIASDYLDEVGDARLSGALSFFEAGDKPVLVVVRPHDIGSASLSEMKLDSQPVHQAESHGVLAGAGTGSVLEYRYTRFESGNPVMQGEFHTVHTGRNVIYVP